MLVDAKHPRSVAAKEQGLRTGIDTEIIEALEGLGGSGSEHNVAAAVTIHHCTSPGDRDSAYG